MRQVFLPTTLDELWDVFERDTGAVPYSGGTDLLVQIRSGVRDPSSLVCLERIEEIRGVRDEGEKVFIGALTTHGQLLENDIIKKEFSVLVQALSVLAAPPIRHMGTIGGNIVNASPAGDTLPPLNILDAEVEIRSGDQSRRMPLSAFILGPGQVCLQPGEIVSGIRVSKVPQYNVHHYEKVGRRKAQACAIASLAAILSISNSGEIMEARLAWGSVGPTVVMSTDVEQALVGRPLSEETLHTAAKMTERVVSPISDIRANAEYRRFMAGRLLLRLSCYAGSELATASIEPNG
jgi:CO/xanthine dehydrogenase FAD-binding subunit